MARRSPRWSIGGTRVHGYGSAIRRAVAALTICASMAVLLAACSADYPTVLAPPTPRGDPEMDPNQLKQATDALISDRDQLNSAAQANSQANPPPNAGDPAAQPATTGSAQTAGVAAQPASGSTQTAGVAAKP
jgi:hypothetical protein